MKFEKAKSGMESVHLQNKMCAFLLKPPLFKGVFFTGGWSLFPVSLLLTESLTSVCTCWQLSHRLHVTMLIC